MKPSPEEVAKVYADELRAAVAHDQLLLRAGQELDEHFLKISVALRTILSIHKDIGEWRIDGKPVSHDVRYSIMQMVAADLGVPVSTIEEPPICLSNSAYMMMVSYISNIIQKVGK